MTLRLLEHYASVQGEGPRVGIPTQFVRFAGCNLKCPKWPCDTPNAIDPKLYRKEQKPVEVSTLVQDIQDMFGKTGAENVCLTGGEPMLQSGTDLHSLILILTDWNNAEVFPVEMFSNGTLPYPDAILESCNIVMDWKLPGSGEDLSNITRIANYNAMADAGGHTIKFTCANQEDLKTALALYYSHNMPSFQGHIYCGPVWQPSSDQGTPDDALTAAEIVKFILEHQLPWKLNLQIHKYVWDPMARYT